MSTLQKWMIGIAVAAILTISLCAFIDWEVRHTKKVVVDKAKVVMKTTLSSSEVVDSTAKITGHLIFAAKNFKKKVGAEIRRLDSTEVK